MSSGTKEGNQQDSSSQADIAGQFKIIILAIKSISSVSLSLSQPVR
ncbi:hypothetical protein FXV91_08480 [Methanosarcina sp. DH2]|jgi:hypothetical protein|nr:hypothetical protein [Methanosarcina sp. DH2]MCC4770230.1 hypothetical protein [Methanosarcina sp. DH2]